jgi:anti-sigma-K factor RskA
MHHELESLAPLYALGALDGEDLSRFTAHLAECEACRTLVREHGEASHGLAFALPPVRPSPAVKREIAVRAARRRLPGAPLAAAAAFVIAVAAAVLVLRGESDAERVRRLVRDPRTRIVEIRGNERMPEAFARVLWNGSEAAFESRSMPALPRGKLYELWAIAEGAPVPLGTYAIDRNGNLVSRGDRRPTPANVGAFAVSREVRFEPSPTEVVALGLVK